MTTINKTKIADILENIWLSDASNLKSRSSTPIIKGNNLAFTIDISGITLDESETKKKEAIALIMNKFSEIHVNIVLTSQRVHKLANNKQKAKIHIEGVKKIIIVTAGKGGVGKSTIASLLAHNLKNRSMKIGILDADIYGPSIPQIFAINNKPKLDNNKMIPLKSHGIELNSIGFITEPSASISWRGPMISKALYQLLSLTKWQNLDCLIIDMPPGTGDIHLSLLENYQIDSALIVTTPQKISEIDVARSINLYKKFNVDIAGIVENMSFYINNKTNEKLSIFAGNSGKQIAKNYDLKLLAKLPIISELSSACDNGEDLSKFTHLMDNVADMILKRG